MSAIQILVAVAEKGQAVPVLQWRSPSEGSVSAKYTHRYEKLGCVDVWKGGREFVKCVRGVCVCGGGGLHCIQLTRGDGVKSTTLHSRAGRRVRVGSRATMRGPAAASSRVERPHKCAAWFHLRRRQAERVLR